MKDSNSSDLLESSFLSDSSIEKKVTNKINLKYQKKKSELKLNKQKKGSSLRKYERNKINIYTRYQTPFMKDTFSSTLNNDSSNFESQIPYSNRLKTSRINMNKSVRYSLRLQELNSFYEEEEKKRKKIIENEYVKVIDKMINLIDNAQFEIFLLNKCNKDNNHLFKEYIKSIYEHILNVKKENEENSQEENYKSDEEIFKNDEKENIILKESNERKKAYNKVFSLMFNSLNELIFINKVNEDEDDNLSTEENVQNFNVNFNVNVNNILNKKDFQETKKGFSNKPNDIINNLKDEEKNFQKMEEENKRIGQLNKYQFKVNKQFNGKNYIKTYILTPEEVKKSDDNFSRARNKMLSNKNKKNNIKKEIRNENNKIIFPNSLKKNKTPDKSIKDINFKNQEFITSLKNQ